MDFRDFFGLLTLDAQEEFAMHAGYSVDSMRMHFCAPGFRRRAPSSKGFVRIVEACEYFRSSHGVNAPTQPQLFEYFYAVDRERPPRAGRTTAAA